MSFENTVTECDLDPVTVQFAEELRRDGSEFNVSDYAVDGFSEPLGERLLRLFRRSSN